MELNNDVLKLFGHAERLYDGSVKLLGVPDKLYNNNPKVFGISLKVFGMNLKRFKHGNESSSDSYDLNAENPRKKIHTESRGITPLRFSACIFSAPSAFKSPPTHQLY
jgi:hypothetical protein